jgi:deferrochelatase/peroxidase EfeB
MRMRKMEKVEWEDVQGLLSSGFLGLPFAAYILLRFVPGGAAETKAWLGGLAERLMRADGEDEAEPSRPRSVRTMKKYIKEMKPTQGGGTQAIDVGAVNFALTASGLKALGIEPSELAQFSSEFREGMAPPMKGGVISRRSNVLGDIGDSSPACWDWGGWNGHQTIDALLLLFAADPQSLQASVARELALMAGAAEALLRLDGYYEGKEHFGFKDGISQPIIEDAERTSAKEKRISVVKPGEFVLGYLNERNARIKFSGASERDLGRNGTYLVFRQLQQDVPAFNRFISDTVKLLYGTVNVDPQTKELVAARLIGRYRSGEPLVPPAADSRGPPDRRNDFLYYFEDRFGLACPIGAHIRRANPRDALGPGPDTALRLSKMHRIIRRGRLYGDRLDPRAKNEASPRRGFTARPAFHLSECRHRRSVRDGAAFMDERRTFQRTSSRDGLHEPLSAQRRHHDHSAPADEHANPCAKIRHGAWRRLFLPSRHQGAAVPCATALGSGDVLPWRLCNCTSLKRAAGVARAPVASIHRVGLGVGEDPR